MSTHAPKPVRLVTPRPGSEPSREPSGEPLWRHVVGGVLRRERLAQRRTLRDVADTARISMPYLSEIERGRKEPSSEVLAAAAHALGLGLADLLALAQGELTTGRAPRSGRPVTSATAVTSLTSAGTSTVTSASPRAPGTPRQGTGPRQGEVRLAA
ncbi:helix-turn-helix domain-containing protein [Streptomyces sp. NPDC055078]